MASEWGVPELDTDAIYDRQPRTAAVALPDPGELAMLAGGSARCSPWRLRRTASRFGRGSR